MGLLKGGGGGGGGGGGKEGLLMCGALSGN